MSLIDILSHPTFFGYAQQFQGTMTASRALPCSCELECLFVWVHLQPTVSTGVAVKLAVRTNHLHVLDRQDDRLYRLHS